MTAAAHSARRARRAEWLYALAYLGAHVGFMPLLVLLLPRRVETLAGEDAFVALSWLLLAGAVTASLAHVAAGAWSDGWHARHGSRRLPVALGAASLGLAYLGLGTADTLAMLAAGVIAFQLALNLMFSPLGALLADYVHDTRKGRVAGMLNAALPLSYGAIALAALLFPDDADAAFYLIGAVVIVLVAPVLLAWPFAAPHPAPDRVAILNEPLAPKSLAKDFARAWVARFAVQLGAALVLGYLFVYVTTLEDSLGAVPAAGVSRYVGDLSLLALVASFAVALAAGLASDALSRRLIPLALLASLAALAQILLALAPGWWAVATAYALFNIGLAGFLAVDSAMVAQMLSGHRRRGALLGLMNLTNTLPAIVLPALTLLAISEGSMIRVLPVMLFGTAGAALLAAVLVLRIRTVR